MSIRVIALGLCLFIAQSGTGVWAKLETPTKSTESNTVSPAGEGNSKANSDPVYPSFAGSG